MTPEIQLENSMLSCDLCGRHCHINRNLSPGACGQGSSLRAARAALHFWEEPCISGINGSGTVFFSGCSLRCVFCQNHSIAADSPYSGKVSGRAVSIERLAEIFLKLQEKGAHNINLVTPSHFIPQIALALTQAKQRGLTLPIVYNTGSYETVPALKMLDGLIDIYLPDLKYCSSELSGLYSNAPDYFSCAALAIGEMFRQVGTPRFSENPLFSDDTISDAELSENHLMTRGVLVRHLLLPGCLEDSRKVLSYLHHTYGSNIFVSIMNQYTPMPSLFSFVEGLPPEKAASFARLTRPVTEKEYDALIDYAISLGMENVFIQEGETAAESFIPAFDGEGL